MDEAKKVIQQDPQEAIAEMEEAMEDTAMRKSIALRLNAAMGLPKTYKSVCSGCNKPGLWLEGAPLPVRCQDCYVEEPEEEIQLDVP